MIINKKINISFKETFLTIFFLICFGIDPALCQSAHRIGQKGNRIEENTKPNIIFILVDDMGWGDVGAFYQNQRRKEDSPTKPYERSPNLDRLANDGAKLTNHYAAAPVCAPSRASLLSGLSQGHANVRNNQFDKALAQNHTLATVLKSAGYATAAVGKWGLQGDNRYSKNGSDWPARPRKRGFDYFLGYMRHVDGHEHYPKEGLYSGSKQVWENEKNIVDSLDKSYTADLWTAAAKKWITNHKQGDQSEKPFFMYLAYDTPHAVLELPTQSYPSGGGLNGGMQWTGKKGQMINTASGTPDSWVHPDYAKATYDKDNDSSTPQVPWPNVYKRYATATRRIDSAVGDIRKLLTDLNIEDNTIIIFSSDNGPSREAYLNHENRKVNKDENFKPNKPTFFRSYGPFDGIKRDTWEGGVREPTIAWWKGHIPAGQEINQPSSQYDWLPTFAEAAGFPAPANSDGVSLLPSLTGQGDQRKSRVYVEYEHDGKTPGYQDFAKAHRERIRKQMQMIRLGDYVGVRYNVQSAEDNFDIYNVTKDPGQRNNLMINASRSSFINNLQVRMKNKVLQMRMPNPSAKRPYDDALIPDSKIKQSDTEPGVNWSAYDGKFPWVPSIVNFTSADSGYIDQPDITVTHDRDKILYFTGFIQAPRDGEYTFYLSTDGKAIFRLHEATVIDADFGYKQNIERSGMVQIEAGLHPFRLYYMQTGKSKSNPSLNFEWSGPNFDKQKVSDKIFFRNGSPKKSTD